MPTKENGLLERYSLELFEDFAVAAAWGDVERFDQSLGRHQLLIIKLGLFELMMKVRRIVIYQFVKMVHASYGASQLPVESIRIAMCIFDKECSLDAAEAIVAGLIRDKMVKAYIDHTKRKIVFSKETPFVEISAGIYPE
jgi:hypothetical protein